MAEELRQKTVAELKGHGLSRRSRRLSLSGYDGYPDEPDFLYIAMAAGASFELAISDRYKPHYGTTPIVAEVRRTFLSDGAGHETPHYDLQQIFYSEKPVAPIVSRPVVPPAPMLVDRRLRLRKKTTVSATIGKPDDIKIGGLVHYHAPRNQTTYC